MIWYRGFFELKKNHNKLKNVASAKLGTKCDCFGGVATVAIGATQVMLERSTKARLNAKARMKSLKSDIPMWAVFFGLHVYRGIWRSLQYILRAKLLVYTQWFYATTVDI